MWCLKPSISLVLLLHITLFSLVAASLINRVSTTFRFLNVTKKEMKLHTEIVAKYYEARKNWVTSNLGTYLFKFRNRVPETPPIRKKPKRSNIFDVIIWKHWENYLRERHLDAYGNHIRDRDPLSDCSVQNCKFTADYVTLSDIMLADALVVHLQKGELPSLPYRNPNQVWIFWTDESPVNTFCISDGPTPTFEEMGWMFNWSMTYRSDSDVPVPYGRTVPLKYPILESITIRGMRALVPYWNKKQRDVLAVNVMSRCVGFRLEFLRQLERFLNVDIFGRCALYAENKQRCPGHFKKDCPVIANYLFYVVIENTNCRQYISEKCFHNAYKNGAIPLILGTPLNDCLKLLPPNSFIHRENFRSIKDLAREIYSISRNETKLLSYHAWRNHFKIREEHGFLGTKSYSLCRICEALNYNEVKPKVYSIQDLQLYLDPKVCCQKTKIY